MKVIIIKDSIYEANENVVKTVLDFASKKIKNGIYAIEKDNGILMLNEKFKTNNMKLEAIEEYERNGYKVYYN